MSYISGKISYCCKRQAYSNRCFCETPFAEERVGKHTIVDKEVPRVLIDSAKTPESTFGPRTEPTTKEWLETEGVEL